jgi:hypothetical protein
MCKIQTRVAPALNIENMYFLMSEGVVVVDRRQSSRLA